MAAVAYVVAGKLGLQLAFVHASATAVWPPTGIALATLLLFGYRAWPAIFAGAFLVNLTTMGTVATSLGIAAGNTLEGLLGALFVNRWANGRRACDRAENIFRFALLAGLLATMVSPTIGVTTLVLGGFASVHRFWPIWLTWWLGDAAGALVVAPPLLLWGNSPRLGYRGRQTYEALLLLLVTAAVGALVLGGVRGSPVGLLPLSFTCLPLIVWAAYRLGPRETSSVILVLSFFAIHGALAGLGAFARRTPGESLLLLQAFMGVVSMTGLPLAVLAQECRRTAAALRRARDELELRVQERTEELKLRESELAEAQAVAHVGSWTWDMSTDRLTWSDELYRVHGLTRQEFGGTLQAFFALVHPDDLAMVRAAVEEAAKAGDSLVFTHRTLLPGGGFRWLLVRGKVFRCAKGLAVRMVGSCQDVTADREAAQRAAAALEEKELLLKEIHHRVKNNLQIVASLLNLQSERLKAPESHAARAALLESRDRIHAMALVDESLSKTEDTAWVDAGAYVRALVGDISRSFAGNSGYVALRVRVGDLRLEPSSAVQCGLILNELISNSLKHAFPERRRGEIIVDLHAEDGGSYVLLVSDDGVGFPEGVDFRGSDTLGLTLITVMVAQLRGTIERVEGPGTTFRMTFPARREKACG